MEESSIGTTLKTCRFNKLVLRFDRDRIGDVIPGELIPYIREQTYLSTKQAPSATLLKKAGSNSVGRSLTVLSRMKFPIQDGAGYDITDQLAQENRTESGSVLSSMLSSLGTPVTAPLQGDESESDDGDTPVSELESEEGTIVPDLDPKEVARRRARSRLIYSDPWLVHAARVYVDAAKITDSPAPLVWQGDGLRLQDPIPSRLLGPTWTGSKRNNCRFSMIGDEVAKAHLIFKHTHWGSYLSEIAYNTEHEDHAWAVALKKRIKAFLKGYCDPSWSKRKSSKYLSEPDLIRNRKTRSERLIELLKTVDGIFMQRFFAYPEEVWTWRRFDMFTLKNIEYLIGDEFLDGELTDEGLKVVTTYEALKSLRKSFKDAANRDDLETFLDSVKAEPWNTPLLTVYRKVKGETGYRKTFLIGLLSQTRGAGTPPPSVLLKSKVKFLDTISSPPTMYSPTQAALVRASLDKVLSSVPDEALTGLATKARVTVTTSASWEETKKSGGTTEAISSFISFGEAGVKVPIIDLESGECQSYEGLDTLTPGEYIFWSSLQEVRRIPIVELRYAFLTMVKEPGKARTVTKARACLKVVLDLVSRICAVPMKKGIASSSSGMGKSHHGWNLFLYLMTDEMKEVMFDPEFLPMRTEFGSYVEIETNYQKTFTSSTDYEEATDYMSHEFGAMAGNAWMLKCGIPRILRLLVHNTCYKERKVFFLATGPLAKIGVEEPDYGISVRSVLLRRGILMGDPLTKIVLHLVNLVARDLSGTSRDPEALSRVLNNSNEFVSTLVSGMENPSRSRVQSRA